MESPFPFVKIFNPAFKKKAGFFIFSTSETHKKNLSSGKTKEMGITIHYKGKLNSTNQIDSFCEEIEDIAKSMEWEYTAIDERTDNSLNQLKGLFIQPHPNSEFLQLIVDLHGNLRNVIMLDHLKDDSKTTYLNHTKTQFAPTDVHIAIVKLFKYLQQKYISNLDVYDEGDYWQTEDVRVLQKKFDFLNAKMDMMEDILNSIKFDEENDAESVADKIEEVLKKRPGTKDKPSDKQK